MLYKKLLALEQVKRWNFHPHLREQSVAAHGHNVAIIAYILATALGLDETECKGLATIGVFHDFAESVTGDIPTLLKRFIKGWDALELVAEIEANQISTQIPLNDLIPFIVPLPALVKLADALDAWLYARTECNLGNGMFIAIRDELNKKVLECTARVKADYNRPDVDLLGYIGSLFAYDFPNASTKDLPEGMSHV